MERTSSPTLPLTSDPALIDDWEVPVILPSSTNSDDFEALHQVQQESTAKQDREREVIRHRAWPLKETFRSEDDYIDRTPLRLRTSRKIPDQIPSSPPNTTMVSISSPILYPQGSSPPAAKRFRPEKANEPRKPKAVGGFLVDDDSDIEDELADQEPASKRRMLENGMSPVRDVLQHEIGQQDKEKQSDIQNRTFKVRECIPEDLQEQVDIPDSTQFGVLWSPHASNIESLEQLTPALPGTPGDKNPSLTEIRTCDGKHLSIKQRKKGVAVPFEQIIAARSTTRVGRAKKSYYGIDIQSLIDEASREPAKDQSCEPKTLENLVPSVEQPSRSKGRKSLMWTEKYRARHFMELVGDDRMHRQVLKWLKAWDPLVFPKAGKTKTAGSKRPDAEANDEKPHRKILLLTGPPGLGKTTLAHVCARQAGYEVMEINASDDRSRDVVKGRIRTSVGTESVKTGSTVTSKSGVVRNVAHPLCVIVDEVDGVVGGSGASGEGGFVKALIDLILLDQKNSAPVGMASASTRKKKKDDDFKLMRPLILICNDVYHPSLRPLRQSNFAEIIHVRKPPLDAVVGRMKSVFEKEGVSCDNDAVRRLCEATWGVNAMESRKGREGTGEGDLRGIMVVGEWAASKLKSSANDTTVRLTRKWVEQNMMSDLSHGGGGARALGRGGAREVVNRVFLEGAGFPKTTIINAPLKLSDEQPKTQLGVAELAKKAGMDRLREMVETSGDVDRIVTDIFSEYPNQPFNDDSILSKPDAAYEWLAFHDKCSSRVFSAQEYELSPYLSQPILACHHLFASSARHHFAKTNEFKKGPQEEEEDPLPFTGPRADYSAHEVEKVNRATILELQASLNSTLLRSFRSPEDIATDLLPYLVRMLTPEVKPIIVGGSGDQKGIASIRKEAEKYMVKRAVDVMATVGVVFERGKLEGDFGTRATQWVYRMEPPLDTLVTFETALTNTTSSAPVRYGVRQVLDQEYQKNVILRENAARQARYRAGKPDDDVEMLFPDKKENNLAALVDEKDAAGKRDFFGRVIREAVPLGEIDGNAGVQSKKMKNGGKDKDRAKVWVTYHEGFSNAVKKPITIEELLSGL